MLAVVWFGYLFKWVCCGGDLVGLVLVILFAWMLRFAVGAVWCYVSGVFSCVMIAFVPVNSVCHGGSLLGWFVLWFVMVFVCVV